MKLSVLLGYLLFFFVLGIPAAGLLGGCTGRDDRRQTQVDDQLPHLLRSSDIDSYVDSLVNLCSQASTLGDMETATRHAGRLLTLADAIDSDYARMYGNLYTGQVRLMTNNCDSVVHYLERAKELGERMNVERVLSAVNNAMGIYYVDIAMDYHKGLSCFMEALKIARTAEHKRSYPIALSNLATTYYMRNDPAGLKYALEAYEIGHRTSDEFIIFAGAGNCACMYYLLGEYNKAEEFILEVLPFIEKYNNEAVIYSLYGNVLSHMGESAKAEHYYRESLRYLDRARAASAVMAYLNYGTYLINKGHNREAVNLLTRGIELSWAKNNAAHRYLLYESVAEAYNNLGHTDEAFRNYRIYHSESDSIFNVERERSTNELRVKYEAERQENELRQNKIQLMQERERRQIVILVLIVILICLVAMYILYRRKNKMYMQIVRQHHEFLRKEKMRESVESAPKPGGDGEHASGDRLEELFVRVEHLMQSEHVYREHDLTSERLAERLGTNRSYLSRTINLQASMTFNAYVNSYRINEAVRLLSDPENHTPLKAMSQDLGFRHIQTFYTVFNNVIGMPPLKFREKIIQLYRQGEKSGYD